jgi:hypothetical protein
MSILKIISVILLGIYLFFSAAFKMFSFQATGAVGFYLGLCAVGAGILMLLSIREYLHFHEK